VKCIDWRVIQINACFVLCLVFIFGVMLTLFLALLLLIFGLYKFHKGIPRIRRLGGSAVRLTNWEGRHCCLARYFHEPTTEAEIIEIINTARDNYEKVRVVGAGHSWNDIMLTNDHLISLDKYNKVLHVDRETRQVTVQAGIRLWQLADALEEYGLAFQNLGTIKKQSIAGAISTGTHGTGVSLGNLSTFVVRMRIITSRKGPNQIVEIDANTNPELFQAARVALGAFGVISTVTIQCREAYNVRFKTNLVPYQDVIQNWDHLIQSDERVKFWWFPSNDAVVVIRYIPTNESRSGWMKKILKILRDDIGSHLMNYVALATLISQIWPKTLPFIMKIAIRVLTNVDFVARSDVGLTTPINVKHLEIEYIVDMKYAKEITEKINKLIKEEKFMMNLPIEIRFTKGDEIWLSPEYHQDSCCFTLQMFRQEVRRALFFQKLESLFTTYKARPHWGKWHSLTYAQLKEVYPKWSEWLSIRQQMDPSRTFTNDYINRVFGL
jgi:FAD-linked oxidoreductase